MGAEAVFIFWRRRESGLHTGGHPKPRGTLLP
jgi:hypothetical protein